MITSVQFTNFRGFQDLTIQPLHRITLIAGQNNSGKTSVLEGIYLAALKLGMGAHELPRLFRTQPGKQSASADDFEGFWSWLFRDHDMSARAGVRLNDDRGKSFAMEIRSPAENGRIGSIQFFQFDETSDDGLIRALQLHRSPLLTIQNGGAPSFTNQVSIKPPNVGVLGIQVGDPTEVAELFNLAVQERGAEAKIEELMRSLEPQTQRLRYSKPRGTFNPLVYCDVGLSRALPSTQMGEGFNRALGMFCQILVSKLDILLVDEIENGLHHSILPAVWRGLFQIAKSENIQLIATTHSWECVRAAYDAAKDETPTDFQYLRLDRTDGVIKCTAVEPEAIDLAVMQGWEMR